MTTWTQARQEAAKAFVGSAPGPDWHGMAQVDAKSIRDILAFVDELVEAVESHSEAIPCPGLQIEPGVWSGCGGGVDCPHCCGDGEVAHVRAGMLALVRRYREGGEG